MASFQHKLIIKASNENKKEGGLRDAFKLIEPRSLETTE